MSMKRIECFFYSCKMQYVILPILFVSFFSSCEKNLENETYGDFSSSTFFKTETDASAAVSAMYTGMMEGDNWSAGWGAAVQSFRVQASQTTDESVCYWGDGGQWTNLNALNFTPDFGPVIEHYTILMPYISEITVDLEKIQGITMNETLKQQYIAELKALRAYYSQVLYLYYGPVPIRTDAAEVNNSDAGVLPRPSKDDLLAQILKDYSEAIAVLPNTFTGSDYGRFSKAACLTARMKLYMQENKWDLAIADGEAIKDMGIFSLIENYEDNFDYNNKGGNSEIIFPIVCSPTSSRYVNLWLAHALPADYVDPSGIPLTKWGGYRMPWKTYDKFDQSDKRLKVLLEKYPVGEDSDGNLQYRDARAGGDIGAVMVKFGPDPTKTSSKNSGVDYPVFRYADVELLLAEAINNSKGGPTDEAYLLINDVRTRAGLPAYESGSMNQAQFLTAIQNERLFELWAEGVRRNDLIRWGLYTQRAIDDGYTVDDHVKLYPLPRNVINESNGVIEQNPGYN